MKRIHYYIGLILLLVSCGPENIVQDAPVKLVSPKQSLSIKKDSTFDVKFSETLSCGDIFAVNDSIMLLYDMGASGNGGCFYKAYSLEDYSFMGEILREGRGPGEVLAPDLCATYRSSEDNKTQCYVFDKMLYKSFSLNLYETISSGNTDVKKISDLPINTLYAKPYRDSLQVVINVEKEHFLFHVIGQNSEKLQTFRLYGDEVSAEQYLSQLGCNLLIYNNHAAMVMLSIPQINFLDLDDGTAWSVAVDRKYKDWRKILSAATDMASYMKSTQYYNNAESTPDYIMALYLNRKIDDILKRRPIQAAHLHIFDWYGNFLYDLKIDEGISRIAYDSKRKYMYGLDTGDGNIYRYDLSHIL